jgi:hypothetical protein
MRGTLVASFAWARVQLQRHAALPVVGPACSGHYIVTLLR